jgi:hypothetical protein
MVSSGEQKEQSFTPLPVTNMCRMFLCLLLVGGISLAAQGQYRIQKIKSIRKYYVIYAVKNGLVYKIVSKKENASSCTRVKRNRSYHFDLFRVKMLGGSEVDCISFDKKTEICKEPGVILVTAGNLKGLCIIENQ